jgi:hypothetical protein
MFEVLKVPMSFTWEIYGDENASYEDCFKMFNPLGQQHFEEVRFILMVSGGLGPVKVSGGFVDDALPVMSVIGWHEN